MNTAQLQCACGAAPTPLTVTSQLQVRIGNCPALRRPDLLMCSVGGVITVVFPGQVMTKVS